MNKNIFYLSYILRHKWYVAKGGFIFGVSFNRK